MILVPWMCQDESFNFSLDAIKKIFLPSDLASFEPLSVHTNRKTKEVDFFVVKGKGEKKKKVMHQIETLAALNHF